MSVALCRSSFASILMSPAPTSTPVDLFSSWLVSPDLRDKPCEPLPPDGEEQEEEEEERPGQSDIWNAIQSQKAEQVAEPLAPPYVHPLVRRSSSLLSQKSLEICTESLGSETGSDGFSSSDEMDYSFFSKPEDEGKEDGEEETQQQMQQREKREVQPEAEQVMLPKNIKELPLVNYHCSISRRSPPRSFPPPLPSISRRDGPCLHMRPHRRDGRLVVEAVPVPSQNYLHAERHGGRLLLSFISTTSSQELNAEGSNTNNATEPPQLQEQQLDAHEGEAKEEEAEAMEQVEEEEMAEEEEEEEEVEVVDRGTVVEVKVSTQPQLQSGAAKVVRSSLVINKFVGVTPVGNQLDKWAEKVAAEDEQHQHHHQTTQSAQDERATEQRSNKSAISTTAAAAAVAATALSATVGAVGDYGRLPQLAAQHATPDNKVLFTSKRRNREELLHSMRRCSQLRRHLFIWEPYCIATSS